MKNLYLLLSLIILSFTSFSQVVFQPAASSKYIKPNSFRISKPLRELPTSDVVPQHIEMDLPVQVGNKYVNNNHQSKNINPDPVVQQFPGSIPLDSPLVNFEGGNYYRPDCSVAAGPNHIVQTVNLCNLAIYDKNGNLQLATDFTALGAGCSDDPIVLYDKFADRWVISDVTNGYMDITVAVSTSPDPTGTYYIYNYTFPVMPDFQKISLWNDGYYATYRDINNDTIGLGVFERNRMLVGDMSAGIILTLFPNGSVINQGGQLPGSPKIFSCDGALPAYGSPNYLVYFTNTNYGDATNSIMIYKMITDTTLHTCHLVFDTSLVTAPFDANFTSSCGWGSIKEPGGDAVWSLDGPFQYRVPYIKFTGYGAAVLCNAVDVGNCIAGIRWYEIRQNDTTQKWSIYQQATYAPNDSISRWNSSICMDLNGDISLAYNVTNSTNLYPGIRFTGRLAGDPLGQMTFNEQTAMLGTHSFPTQWGDYCASALDPDGITFWHTNQYIIDSTGNTANTRIFSFRLTNSHTGIPVISIDQLDYKVYQSNNNLNVQVRGLPSNDKVVVDLFDIDGKQINSQWISPQSEQFEYKINVTGLSKAAYLVRIGNSKFQKVTKIILN